MKRCLLILLVLLLSQSLNAQEEVFRKNALRIETGFFNRGLLGLSYSRHFLKKANMFLSAEAFGGVGLYYGRYAGIGTLINIGHDVVFFSMGVDFKYLRVNSLQPIFVAGNHEAVAYAPHIGMTVLADYGFTGKVNAGFMAVYERGEEVDFVPQIGVALGVAF